MYHVFQRICVSRLVTPLCYFLNINYVFVLQIMEYCSPVWGSAADWHLRLLERYVRSVAGFCPDQGFVQIKVSCRLVIDVTLPNCACRTRLIPAGIMLFLLVSLCFYQSSTYPSSRAIVYLQWPHMQGGCLVCGRLQVRFQLLVALMMYCPVNGGASQFDVLFLTPLSVADCGRLQLGELCQ